MLVMPRPRRERVHVCACIYPSYKSVRTLLLFLILKAKSRERASLFDARATRRESEALSV